MVIQGMQDATAALEEARSKQEAQKSRLDAEWSVLQLQVSQLEQAKARQQHLCTSLRVRRASATCTAEPCCVSSILDDPWSFSCSVLEA